MSHYDEQKILSRPRKKNKKLEMTKKKTPPKPGKKTVSTGPPVTSNSGGLRSGRPAPKSRGGSVSTREECRPDVDDMGSQWWHCRNREKKRYRRAPRCQTPGAAGSGHPARKSRGGSVSTREACRPDVDGMGSQWRHRRNREKKRYRRAPHCHQTPGATGSGRIFLLFIVLA
jgi:hypothetical protein